jgi:hypothetical protein
VDPQFIFKPQRLGEPAIGLHPGPPDGGAIDIHLYRQAERSKKGVLRLFRVTEKIRPMDNSGQVGVGEFNPPMV